MSLAEKQWNRVPIHNVVLAWLRAEQKRFLGWSDWHRIRPLLLTPDLESASDNKLRLRLLYAYRDMFVGEIPPDTEWYEVHNLTDDDLPQVHAVNFDQWK